MKFFTFNADGGDVRVYVGEPKASNHPFANQSTWLGKERGIQIPADIMKAADQLHKMAIEHDISFCDLYLYAISTAKAAGTMKDMHKYIDDQKKKKSTEPDKKVKKVKKIKKAEDVEPKVNVAEETEE